MKKYIYAYYNKLGGFYGLPFVADYDKDVYLEIFQQSLYAQDKKTLDSLLEDDLYLVGTFDNRTAEIVPCNEFLIHCSEYASLVIAKKFSNVVENGKESN